MDLIKQLTKMLKIILNQLILVSILERDMILQIKFLLEFVIILVYLMFGKLNREIILNLKIVCCHFLWVINFNNLKLENGKPRSLRGFFMSKNSFTLLP